MKKFKSALIGCGGAGTNHATALSSHPASEFIAVCDIDPAKAEALAKQFGVRAYTSAAELLEKEAPEVVNIATGEAFHATPACAALKAGAHVFCEKIMASSLAAGKEMIALAEKNQRVLAVNYNYRHIPSIQFLKNQILHGKLQNPLVATAVTHAYCWHHTLDLLCFLLGTPLRITASMRENPSLRPPFWKDISELLYIPTEAVMATIEFSSGAAAHLTASIHLPLAEQMINLSLLSAEGLANLHQIRPDRTLGYLTVGPDKEVFEKLSSPTLPETFILSIHAFLDALSQGRPAPSSGLDGMNTMKLEHAALLSAAQKTTIDLNTL